MQPRLVSAVIAVLFAGLTVAAYGSGTGPWTTGAAGPDVIDPSAGAPEAVHRMQTPEQETTVAPVATTPTTADAVPQAPAHDPAPAARPKAGGRDDGGDEPGDQGGDGGGDHGNGRGLGNTYCQSLKGKGGPAFGHCIAAKAHELHQHGRHR